jgi:hypothetical protein
MSLVTLLSLFAMVLGLGGIVPQLVRMVRARSAAGQSALGWAMGLAANLSMVYVNGAGLGAELLCISSVAGGTLCAVALALILSLERGGPMVAVETAR